MKYRSKSNKGPIIGLLLCLLCLGVYCFFSGKALTGIMILLTVGGFGVWTYRGNGKNK